MPESKTPIGLGLLIAAGKVAVVRMSRKRNVMRPSRLLCQPGILPGRLGQAGSLPHESGRDARVTFANALRFRMIDRDG